MSKKGAEFVGAKGGAGLAALLKLLKKQSGPGGPGGAAPSPRSMGCLILAVLVVVVIGGAYFSFLEYVRPNEFGIKEVQVALLQGSKGIQEKVHEPGFVFVIPNLQKIHRLPRQLQVLELTMVPSGASVARVGSSVRHDRPAKIQTSDGFYVDVDASILYRIVDPYKVITMLGTNDAYFRQGILPKAEPILKQALGELTTEDFYNSPLRVEKAEYARGLLDEEMRSKGIAVEQVLVRYFKYSDAIQQNIEAKKLQDQLVFTNQSKRKAATQEQELNRVSKQGEMQVAITMEEGSAYKIKKDAEKELYVRTKEAEADLLVELAEAERTRLRNESMQELGADRLVAQRMAEVLQGLEVVMIPAGGAGSINPLDLDSMIEMFGVETYEAGASPEIPRPAAPPPEPSPPPAVPEAAPAAAPSAPATTDSEESPQNTDEEEAVQ